MYTVHIFIENHHYKVKIITYDYYMIRLIYMIAVREPTEEKSVFIPFLLNTPRKLHGHNQQRLR